jgi:anthranilate synthase component 1
MLVTKREFELDSRADFQSELIMALVQLGEEMGQPCMNLLEGKEGKTERSYLGFGSGWIIKGEKQLGHDPLDQLRRFFQNWKQDCNCLERKLEKAPDSAGLGLEVNFVKRDLSDYMESGLIGYLDYEWGLQWQRPASAKSNPKYFFRLCPVNIVLLPQSNRLVLEIFGEDAAGVLKELAAWETAIHNKVAALTADFEKRVASTEEKPASKAAAKAAAVTLNEKWHSNMAKETFINSVLRIKEYIRAGDIFQAVFSQKFYREVSFSPWTFYRKLRVLNPSPYLFCVQGEEEILVGSSPELIVSTVGPRISTKPIAGTRPRGKTAAEDQFLAEDLKQDIKENAEHAMLVDLGRNDIGRVAGYGSVRVTQYSIVERFSHVMHLVSKVEGDLRAPYDGLSALQATFPAGTLSGAPKVRAMEILQELETDKRGAYGGALGIIRWNGDVDFCITIRTLRMTPGQVCVQAGAGIVYDSQPEMEYQETLHKAQALMKVVDECVDHN